MTLLALLSRRKKFLSRLLQLGGKYALALNVRDGGCAWIGGGAFELLVPALNVSLGELGLCFSDLFLAVAGGTVPREHCRDCRPRPARRLGFVDCGVDLQSKNVVREKYPRPTDIEKSGR